MKGLMFHGSLQKINEINYLSACETAYEAVFPDLGIERIHGEIEKHGFRFSILHIAVSLKCANTNSEIVDVYIDWSLWRSRNSVFHTGGPSLGRSHRQALQLAHLPKYILLPGRRSSDHSYHRLNEIVYEPSNLFSCISNQGSAQFI